MQSVLMKSAWRWIGTAGLSACCAVTAGCGGTASESSKPAAPVVLKITYGGEPVVEGFAQLTNSMTGEGGGGVLSKTGTVSLDRVALGDYTVTVLPPEPTGAPVDAPGAQKEPKREFANIPKKYRDRTASPLKVQVKAEKNEFAFDLKE
ncbi:MAG: hypothetical protein IT428_31755 [Planctomycetaceae bacterium]|nr:hypothetical protein [Planctomycetaceae bacterium]